MIFHQTISPDELRSLIRISRINFGGNKRLKIFGKLNCSSGKRMNANNRVFFNNIEQAVVNGYRPCGHCMTTAYKKWRNDLS